MERDDDLTLRQMRIFCTLVREGSMTRAAARLRIRQPSVSQQVARMEAQAGAKLVRFGGGEMRLTAAGEFLLAEAQAILAAVDRARDGLAEHARGRRRRLVVGTLPSLARHLLIPAFARMMDSGGGEETVFDVLETTPREAIGRVEAREIDAALISGYAAETPLAPGLRAVEVARDAQRLVVPDGVPDLCATEAPEEVAAAPLGRAIRLALGSDHAEQLAEWHRRLLPRAEVLARCRSYESALSCVEHGLGTAIMPDLTLRRGGRGPRAALYALPLPERRTILLMLDQDRRRSTSRDLEAALSAVSRAIEPMPHRPAPPFAHARLGER